jgi:hypothetical protein
LSFDDPEDVVDVDDSDNDDTNGSVDKQLATKDVFLSVVVVVAGTSSIVFLVVTNFSSVTEVK